MNFSDVMLQKCTLCNALSPNVVCEKCVQILPRLTQVCQCCAQPLFDNTLICGDCLRFPPYFNEIKALFRYQYPVNHLIIFAKYAAQFGILKQLGKWMAEHFKHENKPDVLIPVPSHLKDLKQRGFNQAVELAKWIHKDLNIPINTNTCQCVKPKLQQKELSAKERHQNIRGVFAVDKVPAHWQHLVIIDDVVTTGATVNEIARVFRAQTSAKISVWACARSVVR